jgi:hypothetical protein
VKFFGIVLGVVMFATTAMSQEVIGKIIDTPACVVANPEWFAIEFCDLPDSDEDGFVDGSDNCLNTYNPDQFDYDGDALASCGFGSDEDY